MCFPFVTCSVSQSRVKPLFIFCLIPQKNSLSQIFLLYNTEYLSCSFLLCLQLVLILSFVHCFLPFLLVLSRFDSFFLVSSLSFSLCILLSRFHLSRPFSLCPFLSRLDSLFLVMPCSFSVFFVLYHVVSFLFWFVWCYQLATCSHVLSLCGALCFDLI